MADMAKKEILPAVEAYAAEIAKTAGLKKAVDETLALTYERKAIAKLSMLTDMIDMKAADLEKEIAKVKSTGEVIPQSYEIRDALIPAMNELRAVCDEAETVTAEKYWPFPNYGDLLFGVR